MILSPLGNDTVTVLVRTYGPKDRLGVRALINTPVTVAQCSFQPYTNSEQNTDVDTTVSMWKLYAPPVSVILGLTAVDAIQFGGVVYEDFGDPQPFFDELGHLDHVRIILRKARG